MERENETTEGSSASHNLVRFGPYEVNRRSGEVRKHNLRIRLSAQPLEVLNLLLERPGDVITREELQQRLWAGTIFVDFERSLNSAVKKLRRALNDDPQNPRYIETVPRKGYRFIAGVEPVGKGSAEPVAGTSSPAAASATLSIDQFESQQDGFPRRRWMWIAALGLLAVLIAASTVLLRKPVPPRASPVPAGTESAVGHRRSVAVLGFKNLSGRSDVNWLSTAFTQMLSTELAAGEQVRAIPEENVARAKLDLALGERDGYALDTLRALRANLGSDYVVAGSYIALPDKTGGQVRLDLRLQDTTSGETLANIAVTGKQSEIFELVGRAGQEISAKLGDTRGPENLAQARAALPSNAEAARLYSEGIARLRVSDSLAARIFLEKAIALDPAYAPAHAALASAWRALGYDLRAIASAEKAVELSKNLPEEQRLAAQGRYLEMKADWNGAIAAYGHLWRDHPDDLEAGLRLAAVQTSGGNPTDALVTLSALRKQPLPERDDPRIDLAEAAVWVLKSDHKRQQDLARQAAAKANAAGSRLLLARARLVEGWALDDQGQLNEAMSAYQAAQAIYKAAGDRDGVATALNDIGIVLQKQGDLAGARQKLHEAYADFQHLGDEDAAAGALTNLGEVYRAQGDLKMAEKLFREALDVFRRTGRRENEQVTLNNLGALLYQRADFAAARMVFESLLVVRQATGDKDGIAVAQTNLADVLRIQGELNTALSLYRKSLDAFRETGDRSTHAIVQVVFAKGLMARGDLAAARTTLQEALVTNLAIGAKGEAALDRIMLAQVALEEGHPEQFDSSVRSAIAELRAEQRRADEVEAEAAQARALLALDRTAEASESIRRATAIRPNDLLASFHLDLVAAELDAVRHRTAQARKTLTAALSNAKRVGCVECQLQARMAMAKLALQTGSVGTGQAQLSEIAKEAQAKGFGLIAGQAQR